MTGTTGARPPVRRVTAHARELGAELRRARERARLSAATICAELAWSPAKLSKLEAGSRGVPVGELGVLLGKYSADKETRDRLFRMVGEPNREMFVRAHGDLLTDHLLCLRVHERMAESISSYAPLVVPELAQTEDYARAAFPSLPAAVIGERSRRQEVLRSKTRTTLYVGEAALAEQVGDAAVMHDQMMRLAFMCDWPGVGVRLVPASAKRGPVFSSASTLMTFADPVKPLACSSTDIATVFAESDQAIAHYRAKHRALDGLALPSDRSRPVFERWARHYDRTEGSSPTTA